MDRERLMQQMPNSSDDEEGDFFEVEEPHVPKPHQSPLIVHDKWNFIYFAFLLFGLSSILPWNFFIIADGYWMFKLRNQNNTAEVSKNEMQTMFSSYLSIASQVPATVFLLVNILISSKVPHQIRSACSISVMILLFLLTTVLTKINTDKWQNEFFIITMITVVLLNGFSAVFQGAVMGIASAFPSRFMQALMNGQAVGATFTSLVNVAAIAVGKAMEKSAFIYFCIGTFVLVFTLFIYCCLNKANFYQHYMAEIRDAEVKAEARNLLFGSQDNHLWHIFKRIWIYGLSSFLVYGCTLAVFPAVSVLVVSQHADSHLDINNKYFIPVGCFLIFNLADLTGRVMASELPKICCSKFLLFLLSIIRLSLIPVLMLCNAQPRHLPVVFTSDVDYIIIILCLGLSNGYLITLSVVFASKQVGMEFREATGAMMAFFLGSGLTVGALISDFLVRSL